MAVDETWRGGIAENGSAIVVGDGNVQFTISIEVTKSHAKSPAQRSHGKIDFGSKGRRIDLSHNGGIAQHGNVVRLDIAGDEVRLPIAIKVAGGDAEGVIPHRKAHFGSEGSLIDHTRTAEIPVNGDSALAVDSVGNSQIGLAVTVDISNGGADRVGVAWKMHGWGKGIRIEDAGTGA